MIVARPRVPVITDPAPFRVIAEIVCDQRQAQVQIRLYQRKNVGRPRSAMLHLAWPGKPCTTVEEASEQLLVALAHYVRLLGPRH